MKKAATLLFLVVAIFCFRAVCAQEDDNEIILFKDSINNAQIATTTAQIPASATISDSFAVLTASSTETTHDDASLWEGTIESASPSTSLNATDPFSTSFSAFSTIILIILIGLAVSYVLQKKGLIKQNSFGKVLGIIPLDAKRLIYIAEIAGKYYILGVTEQSINKIDEISNKDMIKLLQIPDKKQENANEAFAKMLKEVSIPEAKQATNKIEEKRNDFSEETNAPKQQETKPNERKPVDPARIEALKALLTKK